MESSAVIWEVLARAKREIVTSHDLAELARRLDRKPEHVTRHLRRESYLLPLFKGYYYVRSPEEIRLGEERRETDTRSGPLTFGGRRGMHDVLSPRGASQGTCPPTRCRWHQPWPASPRWTSCAGSHCWGSW